MFLAKPRDKARHSAGSLVDSESQKIRGTTLSTIVAELYPLMECAGTCQFIRGLWMDISGEAHPIHMRTDAHNLVSTAASTCRSKRRPYCSGHSNSAGHNRQWVHVAAFLTRCNCATILPFLPCVATLSVQHIHFALKFPDAIPLRVYWEGEAGPEGDMAASVVKRITEDGLRKKCRDYIYLDLYKWLESGRSAAMSVNKVVHREA